MSPTRSRTSDLTGCSAQEDEHMKKNSKLSSLSLTRRQLVQLTGTGALGAFAGCMSGSFPDPFGDNGNTGTSSCNDTPVTPRPPPSAPADTTVQVTTASNMIQPAPDVSSQNWLYNGRFPGPELRVAEGDVLRVPLTNDLPEGTTIHWHGVPVPNAMDGVPDVTQQPIQPDSTFTYTFRAEPAGTYFYHSHVGLQLDHGLVAPLIIEEPSPHVEYDREYTLICDDYLPDPPQMPSGTTGGGMDSGDDGSMDGMDGGMMEDDGGMNDGGMMGDTRPPYAGLLINGHLPADPATFTVAEGDRVRFRCINAGSATIFRVRLAGHRMTVSHADGRPVEPVPVDSFVFGPGERYDVIVTADNPGTWTMQAAAVSGTESPARAILQYETHERAQSPSTPRAADRQLQYSDLHATTPLTGLGGSPDRQFDLTLSRNMGESYTWLIDGQAYPDAEPLCIQPGDHVRVHMVNHSPVVHPMHLHGHFFQVKDAVKDTVLVPGHMGEVSFDFMANNPGQWLFHCHNLYHLNAGMARILTYN
jgi:FtsP/CotA-like multicopper oxidase with cupredoxin domain